MRPTKRSAVISLSLVAILAAAAAADRDKRRHKVVAPAPMDAAEFGATPGGAKDISFFRDRVAAGEIPHPNVFTPEGLFSEHDLPMREGTPCDKLVCVNGEMTDVSLLAQPEVRYLAQLGFTSNLKMNSFHRQPVNLVAVIDKSGSMSGQPLELVKESLLQVLSQLGPKDQLSIVLYGDRVHIHLEPTYALDNRKDAIAAAIRGIASAGSTDMESGLIAGFELAEQSRIQFNGTTRVMLFTDERPNVGRTDAKSFMGMAEAASRNGIGMTTIGVGVQFGAELATKISSVRGGNLFFFPDSNKMKQVFTDDFDTMVTELAYDMSLTVNPAQGMKIAGVYGIPGQLLEWTKSGGIQLKIATIFLSKKKGAIYVAFAPDGSDALPATKVAPGSVGGTAAISYTPRAGKAVQLAVQLSHVPSDKASTGLVRGSMLVNQITALKQATTLHHEKNDQEHAYQLVHALASLYRQTSDPDLANEKTLVTNLEQTLAKLSGHQGEPAPVGPDSVSGLPPVR